MDKDENVKRRGRPPKDKSQSEKNSASNEFCSYYSSAGLSSRYFGLNIFDFYSEDDISNLIASPIENNEILRNISLILYGSNGTYTNTVDYMTAMPTLDYVIVTHGKDKKKKRMNKELMESTLNTIRHKEIVRDALFKGMIEGVAFYYFETTKRPTYSRNRFMSDYDVDRIIEINNLGLNACLISLPADYTQIVGIKNSSYVIAFNLEYFNDAQGESTKNKLKKFPKEIRDAYRKWNKEPGNGNWCILDNSKTIVHKIRSKRDEKWGRPLVLAAITDILYSDYFVETKRNVLNDINNGFYYQTFPEGKDKGKSALTEKQQKEQHQSVKGAIQNTSKDGKRNFVSVAAGTKISRLDTSNKEILDDSYESKINDNISLDLGIAGSLLNGVGSGTYSTQTSNLELISAEIFQWIEQIEAELNKCISENIIQDYDNRVECKYLPITHANKKSMVSYAKDLYLQGSGSLSLWASACGVSPDVLFALLDQENEDGIYDKYKPHQTSYTLSSKDQSTGQGRPETDDPTENTLKSQANDGNSVPTPSDT